MTRRVYDIIHVADDCATHNLVAVQKAGQKTVWDDRPRIAPKKNRGPEA